MAIKTIEYVVNVAGITPATEQFGGTQGDHRATDLIFTISSELSDAIAAAAGDGKVAYRFDIYDGEGGVWSGTSVELDSENVSIVLEERHTRFGGKITVYLVITVLSDENDTEVELYSFPAVLRLKNKPEGKAKDGENYESITTLAELTKLKADEAAASAVAASGAAEDVDIAIKAAVVEAVALATEEANRAQNEAENAKAAASVAGDALANVNTAISDSTDQTFDGKSNNAQSGVAVAEATNMRMPRVENNQIPYCTVPVVVGNPSVFEGKDGKLYPNDDAYTFKVIDDGVYNDKSGVDEAAGMIPTRDSKGNLWTGEPVDKFDCANKKYVDNLIGDIEAALDDIIAIQNKFIGGEVE